MPKLYSSKAIIKVLEKNGFVFVSQKGSHAKYQYKENPALIVIVPTPRKEIPFGTFRSILRQASLSEKDFNTGNKR
jgi:predicted RNA binding protein YcfA (HicA-like mRNA interferase family)